MELTHFTTALITDYNQTNTAWYKINALYDYETGTKRVSKIFGTRGTEDPDTTSKLQISV